VNLCVLCVSVLKILLFSYSIIKKVVSLHFNSEIFMFRQVLVPNEQNPTIEIPSKWLGMEVVVLAYPITATQFKEKKQLAWLNGNSKIDNPVRIGKGFRKISRDEIYDRKSFC